ncbi:MAG: 5-oxoprolinase, partial [Acidobacteria bacterium]
MSPGKVAEPLCGHLSSADTWQIWIDTGGTFTDCIAVDPDGRHLSCKVLSSGCLRDRIEEVSADGRVRLRGGTRLPHGFLTGFRASVVGGDSEVEILEHEGRTGWIKFSERPQQGFSVGMPVELRSGEEAPLVAARLVTATPLGGKFPAIAMRLATTRGTNALLERRGARMIHFTTEGFEDLLFIGDQRRPDLFSLNIMQEDPLPEEILGLPERLAADGSVIEDFDSRRIERLIAEVRTRGFDCASIAFLHGHRNGVHEELLERLLRDAGFTYVARSGALSPFLGLLSRSETALADAYLGPIIADYLEAVSAGLRETGARDRSSSLHVMTSAGGLVGTDNFRAMDSLLSGPAGGVVGAVTSGRWAGVDKIIAFDMGGTSTDVARFDRDYEYVFEHRVGPVTLGAPALAIETVAAGGGSICHVEQGRLAVGPQSAGANPGPASYGAGGPLTLTDVNLLLGRLDPEHFSIPVDIAAAKAVFLTLRRKVGDCGDDEEILEGLLHIADERMAEAIRHISVRKGIDPAGYSLVAFGGAGGQHACRVAELLGIEEVLLPGDAGLLSAKGLGHAVIERFAGREILRPLDEIGDRLETWFGELEAEAVKVLGKEGIEPSSIDRPRRIVELRYLGQDAAIEVEPTPDLQAEFERRYFELFSYRPVNRGIEVVSLRVILRSRMRQTGGVHSDVSGQKVTVEPTGFRRCYLDGCWRDVGIYEVENLAGATTIEGPALIQQDYSALVVPGGWRALGLGEGFVRVRAVNGGDVQRLTRMPRPRAVELELMSHRFSGIAREMGELLRRTAISTNIKEREDFSCTLLDPEGRLVVNAPHIPVHLGAMGLCVRSLLASCPMAPGDVIVTNHPAFGGSHLPDVTLIAPVHSDGRLLGYVACRAHHAEIGGIRPGSVPPDARSLAEEGVVIPPILLLDGGEPRWELIEERLTSGPFPTRAIDDNLADLRAMLAAVSRGRQALASLAEQVGFEHVIEYINALRHQAAEQLSLALEKIPDGVLVGRQRLDDGAELVARFSIEGDRAVLDFGGSAGVHPGNLNATPGIVHSVTMYVMRLLVDADLPLNEGLLEPIDIRIPEGMLNPPFFEDPNLCPAVVGGNVETSQRLVDTLLEALGLAGCSQGTMNNLTFGDENFGYYETVAGGSGATQGCDGASGVHTHMTNTRITDPEVLEHRYPVRLHRFAIRRDSGGAGRWRGGDGLIREIEFLAPLDFSILSQHRTSGPYGMHGGSDGAPGRQTIIGADGVRRELEGIDGCGVTIGDHLVLETPGAGGYGEERE